MKYTFFLLLLCLSCNSQKDATPDLHSEYLKDDIHRKWVAVGDDPMIDIFTWLINEHPDEYHKLNPDLIIKSDLKKGTNTSFVRSSKTGILYQCIFEKGDTIVQPRRGIDY